MKGKIQQPKHQYSLGLGLAGVAGLMGLFLPRGQAGPEGLSPGAPVATVGASRSAKRSPTRTRSSRSSGDEEEPIPDMFSTSFW